MKPVHSCDHRPILAQDDEVFQSLLSGRRVLLVDWDLEAPGLERYFQLAGQSNDLPLQLKQPSDRTGLLGMLHDVTSNDKHVLLRDDWFRRCTTVQIVDINDLSTPHNLANFKPSLDILGSGIGSEAYSKRLQAFSWRKFFSDHNGGEWIEELRKQWQEYYDIILIDSRTGLTDSGGVCTVQLPEIMVFVFTPCSQSLDEGLRFIEGVQKARDTFSIARGRLTIFPLLSRWDGDEEVDLAEEWLNRIETLIRAC